MGTRDSAPVENEQEAAFREVVLALTLAQDDLAEPSEWLLEAANAAGAEDSVEAAELRVFEAKIERVRTRCGVALRNMDLAEHLLDRAKVHGWDSPRAKEKASVDAEGLAEAFRARLKSDLDAVAIMPYYNLSDEWQLVASYNYVTSEGANGVRLDRYENWIETGRCDEAHELYFGVNRYICEHKLKWQTGVEYTTTGDAANDGGNYDGWGLTSGIRISW